MSVAPGTNVVADLAVRVTSCCRAAAEFSGEVMHGRVADDGSRRMTFDEAVAQGPGWAAGKCARHNGARVSAGGKRVTVGLYRARFFGAEQ